MKRNICLTAVAFAVAVSAFAGCGDTDSSTDITTTTTTAVTSETTPAPAENSSLPEESKPDSSVDSVTDTETTTTTTAEADSEPESETQSETTTTTTALSLEDYYKAFIGTFKSEMGDMFTLTEDQKCIYVSVDGVTYNGKWRDTGRGCYDLVFVDDNNLLISVIPNYDSLFCTNDSKDTLNMNGINLTEAKKEMFRRYTRVK